MSTVTAKAGLASMALTMASGPLTVKVMAAGWIRWPSLMPLAQNRNVFEHPGDDAFIDLDLGHRDAKGRGHGNG